ncbi:MAG: flagellar hook-associated protein FlgK [Parasphingorhabdus sp.]|nr:flagellar hook-associated protein FlgK [Parasphingorhabdus sp.]
MGANTMSDMLTIGAGGLRAYARALETTSGNIANANNPDYVRRSVKLGELVTSTSYDPLHFNTIRQGGVVVNGLARAADPFLEANTRLAGASLLEAEARAGWLGRTEAALNDGENGVGARLQTTFANGAKLAAAPFEPALRAQFLSDIDATATAFRRSASALSATGAAISDNATNALSTLNQALAELGKINLNLRAAADGSATQASLLDARDGALATISERLDVSINFAAKGVANISYGGVALVDVGTVQPLALDIAPDMRLSLSAGGAALRAPGSGALAGIVRAADGNATRVSDLDSLAENFAADVNGWQAAGLTDAGNAGSPLLAGGGGAMGLTLLSNDPADLALAGPGGAANGNALALTSLRGTEDGWNNIVSTQALATASANSESAAANTQFQAARTARDNLSAVDLDREAADLVRFQQAYEAAARVIQVARETVQSVLAIF